MVSTGVTGESEFSPVLALPSEDELGEAGVPISTGDVLPFPDIPCVSV